MPQINILDNLKGWPKKAQTEKTEITFSGTFEENRIFKEELNTFSGYMERGVLWALLFVGLTCLGLQIPSAYKYQDWFFWLHKNVYNFFFWLSTYTTSYLYARGKYYQTKKNNLKIQKIENLVSADLYQYFSKDAKKVWNEAFKIAEKRNKQKGLVEVNLIDIFLAILTDKTVSMSFLRLGAETPEIFKFLQNYLKLSKPKPENEISTIPFFALQTAFAVHAKNITPGILLCGLAKSLPEKHILQDLFFNLNISKENLDTLASWSTHLESLSVEMKEFKYLTKFKPSSEINKGLTSLPTHYLDQFSSDLTKQAKYGQLPIALGRENDLTEIFKVLSEGNQSLVIKGEEGSGRTTVINELAYKMASEQVPESISDKRLVSLQISAILGSGQKAENVLVNCLNEAQLSGNIVVLLEDLHSLAKVQTSQNFSFLELLLNFVSNSSLQIIGTTTVEEFTETLLNTPNFSSVFSDYELLNLTHQEIVLACCIRASLLERHNGCLFMLDAIEETIRLTDAYTKNIAQPQKAIAILVESASRAKRSENKIVTKNLIQKIISEKTHVPESALSQDESEKLLNLESEMAQYIIGQTPALKALGQALRRARSGIGSSSRPLASCLFLGPTGVGKTEVAKTLAKLYFGQEKLMLRLDMSEYQGPEAVEKFLGAQGKNSSAFVSHIKNYPFCLLLLDEFEKASHEIHNLFLQILDDGRITTQSGETLDLTHALIIATSNAGSPEIQAGIKNGETTEQLKANLINSTLSNFFAPELVNRFDEVIVFSPLSQSEIQQIAILQLQYLKELLLKKGVKMEISQNVVEDIAQNAFDPSFGARPIRRYIQDHIEGYIAKLLLSKDLKRGSEILLDIKDGQLVIE